ncbi:anhydro-N-acetylmuramic acid kinase [Flavobacterium sp.]|uniref:anhydro-N-acetylmuramic acid kinase n=1 Tax=Flavobacterium sp. TaxID=239 RepID=UPI002620F26D|nr:anhydro-N-acetylmuramic acid kinase [Flavobacterium sp.]
MSKENYNVIGVMSGTSLDGVDLAAICLKIENAKWSFEITDSETISYSDAWLSRLKNAVEFDNLELIKLNRDYTILLGSIIKDFIEKHGLKPDAVCSHGHTVLHQPQHGFTLQIGNLPELADLVAQKVVCDFRVQDVRFGGQGAPLVPIGDRLLFSGYDYCLNLGGFSNVSFEKDLARIAFDISPVNTVLNFYANRLGLPYDDKGSIAASGKIHGEMLSALNALDFYRKPFPKSLGFEFVRESIFPLIEKFDTTVPDVLCTFIEHAAMQTALALPGQSGKMLVTGGGAYNDFLIGRIKHHLPKMEIVIPDSKILEYKEALIFGLLGVLKLRNEINVLSSVTGATRDHSSGVIYG